MLREPKGDERNARIEKVVDQLDATTDFDEIEQEVASWLERHGAREEPFDFDAPPPVASVAITPDSGRIVAGDQVQLVVVLLDSWGKQSRIGDANRIKKWLETRLVVVPRG